MGTNYVESSLKRFLKRKVKVTLGLVVSFLITGTTLFAGMEDYKVAEEYLKGIGTNSLEKDGVYENKSGVGSQKITINTENAETTIVFENFLNEDPNNPTVKIDNTKISNKTKEIIEQSLTNAIEKLAEGKISINEINKDFINNGIINGGNSGIAIESGENNGLILSKYGIKGNGTNNGIIIFTGNGMYMGDVINNGILINTSGTGTAQVAHEQNTIVNNGVILSSVIRTGYK